MTPEHLACAIREVMAERNVSTRALARATGHGRATISLWGGTPSHEPHWPSMRVLVAVCAELGVPVSVVVARAEELSNEDR